MPYRFLRRFAITAQHCAACDDGRSCCIITRFVFLNPTNEPFSVPISYLLKGVGSFFVLAKHAASKARFALRLPPSSPRFSQSEAHVPPFCDECSGRSCLIVVGSRLWTHVLFDDIIASLPLHCGVWTLTLCTAADR